LYLRGDAALDQYIAYDTSAEAVPQRLNWRWVALWSLGNIMAVPLFGAIALGLVYSFPIGGERLSVAHAFTLAGMIGGAITGSLLGMGQRLLLRPWIPWAERWIPATFRLGTRRSYMVDPRMAPKRYTNSSPGARRKHTFSASRYSRGSRNRHGPMAGTTCAGELVWPMGHNNDSRLGTRMDIG
jgi:hypothetical protein